MDEWRKFKIGHPPTFQADTQERLVLRVWKTWTSLSPLLNAEMSMSERESSLPGFLKLLLFSELNVICVFYYYYIQNLKNTDEPREETFLNSSKCDFAGVEAAATIDTAEKRDLLRVGLKEKGLGVIFRLKNLPSVQKTWV